MESVASQELDEWLHTTFFDGLAERSSRSSAELWGRRRIPQKTGKLDMRCRRTSFDSLTEPSFAIDDQLHILKNQMTAKRRTKRCGRRRRTSLDSISGDCFGIDEHTALAAIAQYEQSPPESCASDTDQFSFQRAVSDQSGNNGANYLQEPRQDNAGTGCKFVRTVSNYDGSVRAAPMRKVSFIEKNPSSKTFQASPIASKKGRYKSNNPSSEYRPLPTSSPVDGRNDAVYSCQTMLSVMVKSKQTQTLVLRANFMSGITMSSIEKTNKSRNSLLRALDDSFRVRRSRRRSKPGISKKRTSFVTSNFQAESVDHMKDVATSPAMKKCKTNKMEDLEENEIQAELQRIAMKHVSQVLDG